MLILAMTFSGSVVFLAILLCAVLGKRVCSPAWVYNMLKLDLIFFCLPLPVYNSGYKYLVSNILGIPRRWDMPDIATMNFIAIEEGGGFHINFQPYIIVIWAVWACGLLPGVIRNQYKYREVEALKGNQPVSRSDYLAVFDRVKEEVGIKKSITLLCAEDVETICTLGAFQKYVIIPEEGLTEEEIYYSFKHELIHAKRADVAWKYVSLFAVLMHWFNPLAYLYLYIMSVYCERSCDAILVQNLDKAARKRYGKLIIDMTQEDWDGKRKYQTSLSGSKKMIERRLINMLESGKRNKIERLASLLLGAVIMFGGSLTVCAYENPQVIKDADAAMFEALQDEQVTWNFSVGEIQYSAEEVLDHVRFLGNDGICYDLQEMQNTDMERAGCAHTYVSGYITSHHKNADGSCKTDYYYADRCSKCGEVKVKGYSHTETSTKCTH